MDVFDEIVSQRQAGVRCAVATVLSTKGSAPREAGARLLLTEHGQLVGTIGGGALEHRVLRLCREVIASGHIQRQTWNLAQDLGMCCGGIVEVYVEPILPAPRFMLCGAGHIAAALAPMLPSLGFELHVLDAREDLNQAARFPSARLWSDEPEQVLAQWSSRDDDHWLVCTHDHALDQALCEALLGMPAAYIGLVGSRAKVKRFQLRWEAAGLSPRLFARLRAPVGLDIGAQSPSEIAVAVAAQLIQLRHSGASS